jgi:ATP-dependent RNA helicase RhlE
MSFESLGLPPAILKVLASEGYVTPTPVQAASIPPLLEGRDLLGSAQTGTGKTAAFSLPLLVRLTQGLDLPAESSTGSEGEASATSRPRASLRTGRRPKPNFRQRAEERAARPVRGLILAPTRELAIQIQESLRTYGRGMPLRDVVIVGGVSQLHQERAMRQGVDIIVATPGRLVDLLNQGVVDLSQVEVFVLDEADRMFDLGFLPDMKRIIAKLPRQRQNVMFSATMPGPLEELARGVLVDPVRVSIEPVTETRELIEQSLCFVDNSEKTRLLVKLLPRDRHARTIVFSRTKHGADRIAERLEKAGFNAAALHGNKSQNARQRVLAQFKSNHPPVLVATDLAARGIDVERVSLVVNFDLPDEPETYVHRIGRTGRAGATGRAIAFCSPAEVKNLIAIERLLEEAIPVDEANSDARPVAVVIAGRGAGGNRSRRGSGHARPGGRSGGRRSAVPAARGWGNSRSGSARRSRPRATGPA